jgi:hypothetical protein
MASGIGSEIRDQHDATRIIVAAVQQVIRGHHISEEKAFGLIRHPAIRMRLTVEQVSADGVANGAAGADDQEGVRRCRWSDRRRTGIYSAVRSK